MRAAERDVSIGFVSTYPQTVCGLASYTTALIDGIAGDRGSRSGLGVVDLSAAPRKYDHVSPALDAPGGVLLLDASHPMRPRRASLPDDADGSEIQRPYLRGTALSDSVVPSTTGDVAYHHRIGDRHSLETAIRVLNSFDTVSIQHEFGIFGGPDGDEVIDLISGLTVPTAVTFHTVLDHPSEHQRMIIDHLCAHADRLVVMSGIASQRLTSRYGVERARIEVIPHGVDPDFGGPSLVDGRRPLVLTWGLIGPGKGLESAIEAFAGLADLEPRPRYLISGATHPRVRATAGESYREGLVAMVRRHELEDVVEFDDRYIDRGTLARLVRSADLVLLPYESVEQLTSGVLVEAITAAKPVVATAFPHAVELLSQGAGVVVPHGDTGALRAAVRRLLTDRPARSAMAQEARRLADGWDWPMIGRRFGAMMTEMARTRRSDRPSGAPHGRHAVT